MFKSSLIRVSNIMLVIFGLSAIPAVAQHHMGNQQKGQQMMQDQQVKGQMQSMHEMMKHMEQMMGRTDHMLEHMHGKGGMDMMQGRQGMMMHGHKHWMNMMQGTDGMVKSMNQVMEQMQNIMNNENMMSDPLMKEHLENMQKTMGSMMDSMDGFLNHLEEVQKKQDSSQEQN